MESLMADGDSLDAKDEDLLRLAQGTDSLSIQVETGRIFTIADRHEAVVDGKNIVDGDFNYINTLNGSTQRPPGDGTHPRASVASLVA